MSNSRQFDTKKKAALQQVIRHASAGGKMMVLPENSLMAFVPDRFAELVKPQTIEVIPLTAAEPNHLNIGVTARLIEDDTEGKLQIKLSQTKSAPRVLTVEYFEVSRNLSRQGVGTGFYASLHTLADMFDILVIRGMNNQLNRQFFTGTLGRYPSRAMKRSFFRDFGIEPLAFGEKFCTYALLHSDLAPRYVRGFYQGIPALRSWIL